MPLDDMGNRLAVEANLVKEIINPLTALGITPIPREHAEWHKVKETKEFAAQSARNRILVDLDRALWLNFFVPTNVEELKRDIYKYIGDAMPKNVCKLVQTVSAGVENAEFEVEYFDEDPIINVLYTDAEGTFHNDCLAIYKNGRTLAIAKMRHHRRFWLFRLFGK